MLTAFGGSGYEKPQSALCAFVGFFSATFYVMLCLIVPVCVWLFLSYYTIMNYVNPLVPLRVPLFPNVPLFSFILLSYLLSISH
jgi:hypothetical protein